MIMYLVVVFLFSGTSVKCCIFYVFLCKLNAVWLGFMQYIGLHSWWQPDLNLREEFCATHIGWWTKKRLWEFI